jgi:hypothetical protein
MITTAARRRATAAGILLLTTLLAIGCKDRTPSEPDYDPDEYALVAPTSSADRLDLGVADRQLMARIRAATARYQNVDVARAEGYVDDGFGCIADPALGGMGWHLINDALHADAETDPLRPDLLVYEPGADGKLKLVALEYEVFQADWVAAGHTGAPTLLGQTFPLVDFPGLPLLYGLHVWLWRENPSGMFADFNPKVQCP